MMYLIQVWPETDGMVCDWLRQEGDPGRVEDYATLSRRQAWVIYRAGSLWALAVLTRTRTGFVVSPVAHLPSLSGARTRAQVFTRDWYQTHGAPTPHAERFTRQEAT